MLHLFPPAQKRRKQHFSISFQFIKRSFHFPWRAESPFSGKFLAHLFPFFNECPGQLCKSISCCSSRFFLHVFVYNKPSNLHNVDAWNFIEVDSIRCYYFFWFRFPVFQFARQFCCQFYSYCPLAVKNTVAIKLECRNGEGINGVSKRVELSGVWRADRQVNINTELSKR